MSLLKVRHVYRVHTSLKTLDLLNNLITLRKTLLSRNSCHHPVNSSWTHTLSAAEDTWTPGGMSKNLRHLQNVNTESERMKPIRNSRLTLIQKAHIKGIIHPNIKTPPHNCSKQLMVAINLNSIDFFHAMKSMATVNSWVTSILQNIVFCAQQKKESHTGLKWLEDE